VARVSSHSSTLLEEFLVDAVLPENLSLYFREVFASKRSA
jgi:hypothetical protein